MGVPANGNAVGARVMTWLSAVLDDPELCRDVQVERGADESTFLVEYGGVAVTLRRHRYNSSLTYYVPAYNYYADIAESGGDPFVTATTTAAVFGRVDAIDTQRRTVVAERIDAMIRRDAAQKAAQGREGFEL